MLVLPENTIITDLRSGGDCEAQIARLTKELGKQIDSQWWQIGGSKSKRQQEGDHGWSWADIWGKCRTDKWCECLGLVTPDGIVQGAINYHLDGKSLVVPDVGAVFVHHFATAPRNRPWLVDEPQYRGVGSGLLVTAVRHSYLLGLGGRVVIPSLPTEKTKQFYENRGFEQVDADEDGIIDYELTPEAGQQWLREEGFLT